MPFGFKRCSGRGGARPVAASGGRGAPGVGPAMVVPARRVQTEYMKRFREPQWDACGACYLELLRYRLSRRLLEQAHRPWLWDGWQQGGGSSSGNSGGGSSTAGSPSPPPAAHDEEEAGGEAGRDGAGPGRSGGGVVGGGARDSGR